MANVGPIVWYVRDNSPTSTIGWSAVAPWAALTVYAAGTLVRQLATPAVGSGRVFVCIIAGTSLASEPTWTVTKGALTAEAAGPTWQECTGQPGVNGNTTDSPTWLQNKNIAVTIGLIIFDGGTSSLQIVSTAGTTGNGSTPSFSATAGITTADNSVTWTSLGLASGFGAWAAPHVRLANALATNWVAAGNSVFIGDDHVETKATDLTLTAPGTLASPNNIYSIDHALAVTLAAATLKPGASIACTGNSTLTVSNGFVNWNGITMSGGTGAFPQILNIATASGVASDMRWDSCSIQNGASSGAYIAFGSGSSSTGAIRNRLFNTTIKFASTGCGLFMNGGIFIWANTPTALAGGSVPTTLIKTTNGTQIVTMSGVDLGVLGSGKTVLAANASSLYLSLINCALGSGVTIAATPTGKAGATANVISSDSAATNYRKERYLYQGALVTETVVIRTGGASNGATGVSDKIATTANSPWLAPFQDMPIAIYNTVTSTNRVVTLAGIWNAAAVPNNDDIWIEAEYFGSASTPQGSFASNTKANNLATGSALPADSTSAWDSLVTARANTHAYSLGDVIKVATNAGRIFFCTTAGTSAGSEPAGYATAVDGGSVTDGSAVFRAGVRFTLTVTLSAPQPAMAGPIYVTVNVAKVSSTFYVDPLIVLS